MRNVLIFARTFNSSNFMAIQLKGEKRSDIRVKFKLQQFNGQRVKGEEHSDIRLNFKLQQFHGHIVKGEERSDICPQMAAQGVLQLVNQTSCQETQCLCRERSDV